MKKLVGILFAVAALALPASAALQFPDAPAARVNDYAGVIPSAAVLQNIEEHYAAFERDTGHQAVAVLIKTLEGEPIDDVANRLFEKWKLGNKERNDGLLLLIATDDHKARIEVGYGLEDKVPDALAKRVIAEDLTPFFKQKQFATALLVFENRMRDLTGGEAAATQRTATNPKINLFQLILYLLIFGMPVWLFVLRRIFAQNRGPFGHTYRSGGIFRNDSWWGGGWGGGGFGGGGFGGGGGGLSGGGGASGDW